jgi:hypothetical protein
LDEVPLKLGQCAEDMEHETSAARGRIN